MKYDEIEKKVQSYRWLEGAQLSWTTEAETDENTVTDDDNTQTGGNTGGNTQGGDLEG
jgi:hypothetical protein